MYALIAIFLVGATWDACQAANLENRIVNGKNVKIEEFPYMLSIQMKNKFNRTKHICGGAIISEYYGVSSKGCFVWFGTYNHSARSGSDLLEEGGTVTNITKIWKTDNSLPHHPRYHNDCLVFRVQDTFVFSPRVQPVRLPQTYSPVTDGTVATVVGWGAAAERGVNSKHLRAVRVPIVGLTECRKTNIYVRENNLCAGYSQGGKTFCGDDLGGPLVADGVLIGIAAADYYCGTRPGEYGIYTNVSHYVKFITEVKNFKLV